MNKYIQSKTINKFLGVFFVITEYGYDVFFTITALCFLIILASYFFIETAFLKYTLITLSLAFFLFTLNFFRDPERKTPQGKNLIIAPADGKIIIIQNVMENEYLKEEATQISIFMSPLNVHVNRNPITGKVGYVRYVKGEFFAAFEDKASLKNEQTHIGMENEYCKVFFKQIAGFVARRIVCPLKEGDNVVMGERFGMIKFGSRVDIFVPKNSEIKISMNQKTVAGETILAVVP